MIIRGITIRSKLIIATALISAMMLAMSLVIMDASKSLSQSRELLRERSEMIAQMRLLEYSFYSLAREESPLLHATLIKETRQLEADLADLIRHPSIATDEALLLYAGQIESSLRSLMNVISDRNTKEGNGWSRAETELFVLGDLLNKFNSASAISEKDYSRKQSRHLALALSIGIICIIVFLGIFTFNLSRTYSMLISYTSKIRKGSIPPPLKIPSGDEMSQVAENLNIHSSDLQDKINYLTSISGEGPVSIYTPHEEDEVGNALVLLSNYLNKKELNEVSRNREDKKQNWISAGNAQIGDVLRSERENVEALSFSIIQKLVSYMNVEMGSLFTANHSDPDHPTLELTASYAYDRRKYMKSTLEWGSGLPGTCAQEKKRIFLTEVPENYFEISSGTGSSRPNCLLLVPMIIDDTVHGIIELATVRLLRPFEVDFVESLAEGIASSLQAVQANERTNELLKQSRAQAEALRTQEAVLLENMNKLEESQAESEKKESEISGILNAINQSTLVAELGLNGRYH